MLHRTPAALLWPTLRQLLLLAINAQAAKFDERLRAPINIGAPELKTKLKSHFQNTAGPEGMLDLVTNRAQYEQWIDTRWQLGKAIDRRVLLTNLRDLGVVPGPNGSYDLDLQKFPQWLTLDERMVMFLEGGSLRFTVEQLRNRGFRADDIATVESYVALNNPKKVASGAREELVRDFSARVVSVNPSNGQFDRQQILAFVYQRERNTYSAYREWALGLLNLLDKQRQRILESFLMEQPVMLSLAPTDVDATLDEHISLFRSGEYLQSLEREKEQGPQ